MIAVAVVGVASLGVQNADARATKTTFELRPVLAPLPAAGTTSTTLAPADRVDAGLKEAMCDEAGVAQLAVVPTTPLAVAHATDCVVFPAWPGRPSFLPTIQPDQANFTSFQGTAIISGAFTGKQARAVAAAIRAANSR